MVRVPCRSQKQGVLNGFLCKNAPFSADFRFDRVCETAKSKNLHSDTAIWFVWVEMRSFHTRFTLTFPVISGIQDRLTGNFSEKQRSQICNSG